MVPRLCWNYGTIKVSLVLAWISGCRIGQAILGGGSGDVPCSDAKRFGGMKVSVLCRGEGVTPAKKQGRCGVLSDVPVVKSLLLPQVPVLIVAVLVFWGAVLEVDADSMYPLPE